MMPRRGATTTCGPSAALGDGASRPTSPRVQSSSARRAMVSLTPRRRCERRRSYSIIRRRGGRRIRGRAGMSSYQFYFSDNHHLYRYCPRCATPLERKHEGNRLRPTCPRCGFIQYQNPPLAATIILSRGDKILMGRRTIEPRAGYWTFPGGYVELGESAEEAAIREAKEEMGIDVRVD